jgi:F-type H+-transporting ATPase subunit epsilon
MNNIFRLTILSAEKIVFNEDIHRGIFPGVSGPLGILKNHMPLISALTSGEIDVQYPDETSKKIPINGGILNVANDAVTVFLE